jgi:hypothetical protein
MPRKDNKEGSKGGKGGNPFAPAWDAPETFLTVMACGTGMAPVDVYRAAQEVKSLIASEDGRKVLASRMYVAHELLRGKAMQRVRVTMSGATIPDPDLKAALIALDQMAKLSGVYSPTRVKLSRDEEELAKLTDAQILERREKLLAGIAEEAKGISSPSDALARTHSPDTSEGEEND